jgi:hypothetical protein
MKEEEKKTQRQLYLYGTTRNLIFFQTLPTITNYHSKWHLLTINTRTLLI